MLAPLLYLLPGARAADIPITGRKLIVVDKTVAAGKAKAVFVSKDPLVTKGAETDPAQIEETLEIGYDTEYGAFLMPQGGHWLGNSTTVAKYVNKDAPNGGAVKVSVIKPAKLVKVVGKSLGDAPLSIASLPSGAVHVVDTIVNGGEVTRLCTEFPACVHKVVAGGTGYKLVCKAGVGDASCEGARTPLPACGDAEAYQCDGVCPAGYTCLAFLADYCSCGPNVDPIAGLCGELAGPPTCLGECPPWTPICADLGGVCTCLGSVPCGSSAFPQCNGTCPVGEHCLPVFEEGGADCVCATSSQCSEAAWCLTAGACTDPYECALAGGLCYQAACVFSGGHCSSDCSCEFPGGCGLLYP